MAFQVIPESFLDRMIKGWVQLLRKCSLFLPVTTQFYGKIVPKIPHLSRVSTFCLQINAPNGTFSQPESTTGACRDRDARNCFDARTISDARGSNDARTEKRSAINRKVDLTVHLITAIHKSCEILTKVSVG